MITDLIIGVLLAPIRWVLDVIPAVPWPSWFQKSGTGTVVDVVGGWGSHLGTINGWFPVGSFLDALSIVFVVAGIAVTIRIVRMLISVLTGGGGAV